VSASRSVLAKKISFSKSTTCGGKKGHGHTPAVMESDKPGSRVRVRGRSQREIGVGDHSGDLESSPFASSGRGESKSRRIGGAVGHAENSKEEGGSEEKEEWGVPSTQGRG
jgi:hypothetical protein